MADREYGDYSRIARMAELRFLGAASELLTLPLPVDLHVHRPGMACFYYITQGYLRLFPEEGKDQHYDLGPGHAIGIEDGGAHRWLSYEPKRNSGRKADRSKQVELYAGYVDRRHTVIQRLLGAVIIMPPDASPHADIVRRCVEALVIEQKRADSNEKVVRRFSEILQLEMLDFANRRLSEAAPIPSQIKRDAPLLRAWTAFLNDPARRWSIAELAEVAGVSRAVLFERFHRALGKTPLGAIREIRIQYAAAMLRSSQAPISEIAAKVGYGSDVALLRAFRRELGVTPAAWREGDNAPRTKIDKT